MHRPRKPDPSLQRRARASRRAPLCAAVALMLAAGGALAAGSANRVGAEARKPAAYDEGMKLVSDGKLEEARKAFERASLRSRKDPEILNMLAYTQRKTGQLDEAIENYRKALSLRPDFPEAREYLGEAYLQGAIAQLDWLEEADAKELHGQLLRAIRAGADALPPSPGAAGTAPGSAAQSAPPTGPGTEPRATRW